jgi:hypothetical protein
MRSSTQFTHQKEARMSDGRRPIDRYLDRLERILERCVEADKAERKKRRAAERQKKLEDDERPGLNADEPPKH